MQLTPSHRRLALCVGTALLREKKVKKKKTKKKKKEKKSAVGGLDLVCLPVAVAVVAAKVAAAKVAAVVDPDPLDMIFAAGMKAKLGKRDAMKRKLGEQEALDKEEESEATRPPHSLQMVDPVFHEPYNMDEKINPQGGASSTRAPAGPKGVHLQSAHSGGLHFAFRCSLVD